MSMSARDLTSDICSLRRIVVFLTLTPGKSGLRVVATVSTPSLLLLIKLIVRVGRFWDARARRSRCG